MKIKSTVFASLLLLVCTLAKAQAIEHTQCNVPNYNYANTYLKIYNGLKMGKFPKSVQFTDSSGIDSLVFRTLSEKYRKAFPQSDYRSLPFHLHETPGKPLLMQNTQLVVKDEQATYQLQLRVTFERTAAYKQQVKVQKIEILIGPEIKPFDDVSFKNMLEEMKKPEENILPPPPPPPGYND